LAALNAASFVVARTPDSRHFRAGLRTRIAATTTVIASAANNQPKRKRADHREYSLILHLDTPRKQIGRGFPHAIEPTLP
jgi:hypothetical protein